MTHLSKELVKSLDARFAWAYGIEGLDEPNRKQAQSALSEARVTLRFPLGELTNPGISGFVWAWNMQGKIQTTGITDRDRFNAQGLEGAVEIRDISLVSALLAVRELPDSRWAILGDTKALKSL